MAGNKWEIRGIVSQLNVYCCLIFGNKPSKIPYTYTGIANLFSNRRVYFVAAAGCSTDALLSSQIHELYKVASGFTIDYKHEDLISLTFFFKFYCKETTYSVFEDK